MQFSNLFRSGRRAATNKPVVRYATLTLQKLEDRTNPGGVRLADLMVTSVVAVPSSVEQTGRSDFLVTVRNDGPHVATTARLYTDQPNSFAFRPGRSSPAYNYGGYQLLNLGHLRPGQCVTKRVSYDVGISAPLGSLPFRAWVTTTSYDYCRANNSQTVYTTVNRGPADTYVAVNALPLVVTAGQPIPVKVTIGNNGRGIAVGANATIPVPSNLGVLNGVGYSVAGNVVTVSAGNLRPGQRVTRTVYFTTQSVGADSNAVFTATSGSLAPDRNQTNNVRSDSTFISVPYAPQLQVAVRSMGSGTVVAANTKTVPGMTFDVHAGSTAGAAKDLFLTSVDVGVAAGSPFNAQNLRLQADTNGDLVPDTFVESGVTFIGGHAIFDNIAGGGYVIPANQTVRFAVTFDASASIASPNTLRLQLAGVTAERLDNGVDLTGSQIVTTHVPSPLFTFQAVGSLQVTMAPLPIRNHQYIAGVSAEDVGFALTFTNWDGVEDIDVTKLRIVTIGSTGESLSGLKLFNPGDTTPFGQLTVAGNGTDPVYTSYNGGVAATLTGNFQNQQFIVAKGTSKTVYVRPGLDAQQDGAVLGERLQFGLLGNNDPNGLHSVEARGIASSNNLGQNTGAHAGQIWIGNGTLNQDLIGTAVHTVVGNEIVEIRNTQVDTGLFTGVGVLAEHEWVSSSNVNTPGGLNKSGAGYFTYDVTLNNATMFADQFFVYNKADTSVKDQAQVYQNGVLVTSGTVTGTFQIVVDLRGSAVNHVVGSGERMRLVLQATTENAKVVASQASSARATLNVSQGNVRVSDLDAIFSQELDFLDTGDTLYHGNTLVA